MSSSDNRNAETSPLFSICIPAYEMHGRGVVFLSRCLEALDRQTLRDFEVIVSDHSLDTALETLCENRRQFYPLRYLRYASKRGNSSANSNHAMRQAKGQIVKIIHQDDFIFADAALARIARAVRAAPGRRWGGVGCIHVNETETSYHSPRYPRMDPMMASGQNTFGGPSVMFVRRENVLEFDEELIWLSDCELYHRLNEAWGGPLIIEELLVANRQWSNQVTHTLVDNEVRARELDYVVRRHNAAT